MEEKDWYKVEIRELIRKNLGKIHRKVGDSYGIDVSYLHKMISDYATQELSKAREEGKREVLEDMKKVWDTDNLGDAPKYGSAGAGMMKGWIIDDIKERLSKLNK